MSYIANATRVVNLTIAGEDYTESLVSWTVSDESANKNGCISTSGSLVLTKIPGSNDVEDYFRNYFRRGDVVTLDLRIGNGPVFRHPRGYLYVVTTSYNTESETLGVEIACKLSMMSLTENYSELTAILPVPLDVVQDSYQGCCAAFASVGQYVFQNNQGGLGTGNVFNDAIGGAEEGRWVSILGVTALSVAPLQGQAAIPDEIELSYEVPTSGLPVDERGRVEETETSSYYFTNYPIVNYERQNTDVTPENPEGTLDNVGSVLPYDPTTGAGSTCGNSPERPEGNGNGENGTSCNDGFVLVQSPLYVPATRIQKQKSVYDGPGAQVSMVRNEIRGPRLEANPGFFADSYSYCRQTWGSACEPNGSCPQDGLDNILLGYSETTNTYGAANELVKQVVEEYATRLSGAQPSDWRAGNTGGQIQEFDPSVGEDISMYRQSRAVTTYTVEGSVNVQTTELYTSMTSRGTGIKGGHSIDALDGIKTSTVRRSTSKATLDIQPDMLNSPTTATETRTTNIVLNRENGGSSLYGDYVIKEAVPVPLLFDNEAEIDSAVQAYSNYLGRFVKGDSFGLQIGEALRSEIAENWHPGQSFRYYDPGESQLIAMRMDATAWGVSSDRSALVTQGIWIGFSNGSVTIPSNVQGNSSPDMGAISDGVHPGQPGIPGGEPSPPPPEVPPSVEDETIVDSGPLSFDVTVDFSSSFVAETLSEDGIQAGMPETGPVRANWTSTAYISGAIVAPGGLLSPDPDGGIPFDYNGNLIVVDATVIAADLFA